MIFDSAIDHDLFSLDGKHHDMRIYNVLNSLLYVVFALDPEAKAQLLLVDPTITIRIEMFENTME
jgi:hypothetical protein